MVKLKNFVKALVSALVIILVVAACSAGQTAGEKVFKMATINKTDSLNNVFSSESANFQVIANYLEGLTTYDENGEIIGSMAESWEVSPDNLVYTFKLKEAKWSNGAPVTAYDFVYGWQQLAINEKASYANLVDDLKNGKDVREKKKPIEELGVEAVNDKELKVTLVAPRAYFLQLVAFPVFFPVNKAFVEEIGGIDNYGTSKETVLANGPFKLDTFEMGGDQVFVKNDDYWNASNVKLDRVEVKVIEQLETQATLYEQGEIDYMRVSGDLVDKYASNPDINVQEEPTIFYFYLSGTNQAQNKLLANKNFRAAVAHAIDKQAIAEKILKNGSTAADYLVPKNFATLEGKDFREYSGKYNEPMYNVQKAQEYLALAKNELGGEPLTFTIKVAESQTNLNLYQNITEQIKQNLPGVEVNIEKTIPANYFKDLKNFNVPAAAAGWGPDFKDVSTFFYIFLSGDSHNYGQWKNPDFDALYSNAQNEANPKKRWDMFAQAEQILLDDYAIVPVFQRGAMYLKRPTVEGVKISPVAPEISFKYLTINE